MKNKFEYRKILIVGCGGAGKSTLATEMGAKLDLPVVHLDKLWWLPGWTPRERDEFDALLEKELAAECWIMEGNFKRTFAKRLEYADFCIFLDYPAEVCLQSVRERNERFAGRTRPDMAEGCPEQPDPEFDEWIKSYNETARPVMLEALHASGVAHKIFTSREQTAAWLNSMI